MDIFINIIKAVSISRIWLMPLLIVCFIIIFIKDVMEAANDDV